MIYQTLKVIVHITFRIFFRKIFITNRKAISKEKATILALNHPTAFLDPMLICTHIRPTTHFMLRGDIFNSPLVVWFLKQIKTIPIFRFRDGFASLKQNQSTFDYCYKLLSEKAHIIILAEGNTVHEKRLRPIQKGTARMAFGAYEKYGDKEMEIIPVGVNYTDSVKFRSEIMSEVGEPIRLKDYLDAYNENPRKAVRQITVEIQRQLNDLVVHIDKDEDIDFVNNLLKINRHNRIKNFLPRFSEDNTLLKDEVRIARKVNEMGDEKKELKNKVTAYFQKLKNQELTDLGVAQPFQFGLRNTIILIIGILPFLIGYITNFIPFAIAKGVADAKVKRLEFHSSVRLGVCFAIYTLMFLFFLIGAIISGNIMLILAVFLIPFCGHFAVLYQDIFYYWNQARKAKGHKESAKLREERKKILETVN